MALKSKFCVKCGKETASLIESKCPHCYLNENKIRMPHKLELKVCPKCHAVKWLGAWIKTDNKPLYYFQKLFEEAVKVPKNVEVEEIKLEESGTVGISIKILDLKSVIYRDIELHIDKFCCPECSRQKTEWESKIQIRGLDENSMEEVLHALRTYQQSIIEIKEMKDGFDIELFSKEAGNCLMRYLRKRYGFTMEKSFEQHGFDNYKSKQNFREVLLLKPKE